MIKLNFDYTDIKKLRTLLNVSATNLAERIPICRSHMSDLENSKKSLSLDMYKRILDCLNVSKTLLVDISNINLKNKEEEYIIMKNNIDLTIVERIENMIDIKTKESIDRSGDCYCIDGLYALKELLTIYKSGDNRLLIATNQYPVYDSNGEDCSDELCSKVLHLDRDAFNNRIMKESYISDLDISWSVPTIEGYEVDLYALVSGVTYYNDLPVLDGMFYRVLVDKTYDVLADGVIYKGEVGYNECVEDINGIDMLCIYFGKGETPLSKREYYNFDEVEVVKQIVYPNGCCLLGEITQ